MYTKGEEGSEKQPLLTSTITEIETIEQDNRPQPKPDGFRAWSVAFAIFLINFIIGGLGRVSGIFYVKFMRDFRIKRSEASVPFTVQQSNRNLFGPVVGILGQMLGVRILVMTGGVLAAVSAAGCAYANDILWISILWGDMFGIANAFTSTINQLLLDQYFVKNRSTASGLSFAGGSVGSIAFPVLIEKLMDEWGVPRTFFTMAVLLLLIVPLAIIMKPPPWLRKRSAITTQRKIEKRSYESADSSSKQSRLFAGHSEVMDAQSRQTFTMEQKGVFQRFVQFIRGKSDDAFPSKGVTAYVQSKPFEGLQTKEKGVAGSYSYGTYQSIDEKDSQWRQPLKQTTTALEITQQEGTFRSKIKNLFGKSNASEVRSSNSALWREKTEGESSERSLRTLGGGYSSQIEESVEDKTIFAKIGTKIKKIVFPGKYEKEINDEKAFQRRWEQQSLQKSSYHAEYGTGEPTMHVRAKYTRPSGREKDKFAQRNIPTDRAVVLHVCGKTCTSYEEYETLESTTQTSFSDEERKDSTPYSTSKDKGEMTMTSGKLITQPEGKYGIKEQSSSGIRQFAEMSLSELERTIYPPLSDEAEDFRFSSEKTASSASANLQFNRPSQAMKQVIKGSSETTKKFVETSQGEIERSAYSISRSRTTDPKFSSKTNTYSQAGPIVTSETTGLQQTTFIRQTSSEGFSNITENMSAHSATQQQTISLMKDSERPNIEERIETTDDPDSPIHFTIHLKKKVGLDEIQTPIPPTIASPVKTTADIREGHSESSFTVRRQSDVTTTSAEGVSLQISDSSFIKEGMSGSSTDTVDQGEAFVDAPLGMTNLSTNVQLTGGSKQSVMKSSEKDSRKSKSSETSYTSISSSPIMKETVITKTTKRIITDIPGQKVIEITSDSRDESNAPGTSVSVDPKISSTVQIAGSKTSVKKGSRKGSLELKSNERSPISSSSSRQETSTKTLSSDLQTVDSPNIKQKLSEKFSGDIAASLDLPTLQGITQMEEQNLDQKAGKVIQSSEKSYIRYPSDPGFQEERVFGKTFKDEKYVDPKAPGVGTKITHIEYSVVQSSQKDGGDVRSEASEKRNQDTDNAFTNLSTSAISAGGAQDTHFAEGETTTIEGDIEVEETVKEEVFTQSLQKEIDSALEFASGLMNIPHSEQSIVREIKDSKEQKIISGVKQKTFTRKISHKETAETDGESSFWPTTPTGSRENLAETKTSIEHLSSSTPIIPSNIPEYYIDFRFLHENINYLIQILRITQYFQGTDTPLRDKKDFQFPPKADIRRDLDWFLYCMEESISRDKHRQIKSDSTKYDSDPSISRKSSSRKGSGMFRTSSLDESSDSAYETRYIYQILLILFREDENSIASHFPEQDQAHILKLILELKKLVRHCHILETRYSNESGIITEKTMLGPERVIVKTTYIMPSQESETQRASDTDNRGSAIYASREKEKMTNLMASKYHEEQTTSLTTQVKRPFEDSLNGLDLDGDNNLCWKYFLVALRLHTNPLFLLITICRIVHLITFMTVLTIIVDFGIDKGLQEKDGKYLIAAMSLGDLIGRLCCGWVTDFGLMTMECFMAFAMLGQGAFSASLPYAPAYSLYIMITVFSILQGCVYIRHPIFVSKYTKGHEHSIGMGFINLPAGIVGFILPSYIGHFRDQMGSYDQFFIINGIICAAIGVIWLIVALFCRQKTEVPQQTWNDPECA